MVDKYVVKGCPFLAVAHYAQGDIVEDQCSMTEYELCADREDCILKKVASMVESGNIEEVRKLLQLEKAKIFFKV